MNNNFCVIMAGGVGSRFWPLSRQSMPKQFLDIFGTGKSFIRSTYERFLPIVPSANFFVVTSDIYKDLVLEHIPELKPEQILCEPFRRNTAPCIAYASYKILKQCPDANIIVAPSDHLVTNEVEFQRIMSDGLKFVNGNTKLLTVGIKPSRPETGYGYIQIEAQQKQGEFYKVKTFTEKPNLDLAKVFVASGEFHWNSGIFIWSVNGILDAFKLYLPEMNAAFEAGMEYYGTDKEEEFIRDLYAQCENKSIDYGIMERAQNVFVRPADFGWSDIGTWGSLYTHVGKDENQNAIKTDNVKLYNTENCVINISPEKVAVIENLDGYLVVDTDKCLMICKLENEQSIRNYVEDVKYKFGEEYI